MDRPSRARASRKGTKAKRDRAALLARRTEPYARPRAHTSSSEGPTRGTMPAHDVSVRLVVGPATLHASVLAGIRVPPRWFHDNWETLLARLRDLAVSSRPVRVTHVGSLPLGSPLDTEAKMFEVHPDYAKTRVLAAAISAGPDASLLLRVAPVQ